MPSILTAMYILSIAMDQLSTRIQLVNLLNQPVADLVMFELKLLHNTSALELTGAERIDDYISKSGIR